MASYVCEPCPSTCPTCFAPRIVDAADRAARSVALEAQERVTATRLKALDLTPGSWVCGYCAALNAKTRVTCRHCHLPKSFFESKGKK